MHGGKTGLEEREAGGVRGWVMPSMKWLELPADDNWRWATLDERLKKRSIAMVK